MDNYENYLSFRERIQRFITYSKNNKHPVIVLVVTIVLLAAFILLGTVFSGSYLDPSTVELNAPSDTSVQITFVGDVMMGRAVKIKGEKEGYDKIFNGISALWKNSDIVMGNFECVALEKDESHYKKSADPILFSSTADAVKALKNAGFNLMGLANDHFCNFGRSGMKSTFELMKKNNLEYVGAGYNIEEAIQYYTNEINGFKISIVAGTEVSGHGTLAGETYPGSLSMLYTKFYDVVDSAASESDLTVVFIHWGDNNILNPTDEMVEIGHKLIDAGADIIIGAHPHVLLPVEKYRDGIICYSLGSFVFDQGTERQTDSTLLNYTVTENGDGQMEFVPVKIVDASPQVAASNYDIDRINHFLTKSLSNSDYTLTDDGHIIITAPGIDPDSAAQRREREAQEAEAAKLLEQASTQNSTESVTSAQ